MFKIIRKNVNYIDSLSRSLREPSYYYFGEIIMGYVIEPLPLTSFIDDSKIQLPRFQRRETWNNDQKFKLCISVYKEFPVGVVIINEMRDSSWLLDGRQRRNALQLMRDNPVNVYNWARSFLKFKVVDTKREIRDTFWKKIEEYLQEEPNNETKNGSQENINVEVDSSEELIEESQYEDISREEQSTTPNSFDKARQQQSLAALLDLILMVHPIRKQKDKSEVSEWQNIFNFANYFNKLPYIDRQTRHIDPILLKKYIVEFLNSYGKSNRSSPITQEYFIDYILNEYDVKDDQESEFRKQVDKYWSGIEKSFNVISRSEKIIGDARIGVVKLTNASTLDAQNIFSLVNTGGTKLKPEELLSAKPFWNKEVQNTSQIIKKKVDELYDSLTLTQQSNVVRWDLCAIFLSRIDKNNYIFKKYDAINSPNDPYPIERITLGFKLISALIVGGISGRDVARLETLKDFENQIKYEELVEDLNYIIDDIIGGTDYFKYLHSWNKPIVEVTTNTIALEFITLIYNLWISKGKPHASSGELKDIKRKAVILYDRLVFEYVAKSGWKGSSDSQLAKDIKNSTSRFEPIRPEEWMGFIESSCVSPDAGIKYESYKPFLYHYYALNYIDPHLDLSTSVDIDHIIPQEKFKNNLLVDEKLMNSLGNLALLPSKENNSKKAKTLEEIHNPWLKGQIITYTGIQENDFEKYSDISNLSELIEMRKQLFQATFREKRQKILSN